MPVRPAAVIEVRISRSMSASVSMARKWQSGRVVAPRSGAGFRGRRGDFLRAWGEKNDRWTVPGLVEGLKPREGGSVPAPRKYPNELRERAIRLVVEAREQEPELSLTAAVNRISPRLG